MIDTSGRKLVIIEWWDSKGITSDWEFWDGLDPILPCKITSVGYLIDDNESYKTIVQSISESQVLGRMTVPCCAIIRLVELKAGLIGKALAK